MKQTDKNGIPLLPELIEVNLHEIFQEQPVKEQLDVEDLLEQADQELKRIMAK